MPQISVQFLLSSPSRLLNHSSPSQILKISSALLAQLTRIGLLHKNLPSPDAAIFNNHSSIFSSPGDITPWNALIASLSRQGFPFLAIQAFSLMHRIALPLDSYSLCSALSAASSPEANTINIGKQIHDYACKSGEMSSVFVGGALIDFYARTDAIQDAHKVYSAYLLCRWMDGYRSLNCIFEFSEELAKSGSFQPWVVALSWLFETTLVDLGPLLSNISINLWVTLFFIVMIFGCGGMKGWLIVVLAPLDLR